MNVIEAAKKIGVSVRTLHTMIARGDISARKVQGKTGLTYDFEAAEVERAKKERETAVHVAAVVKADSQAVAQRSLAPFNLQATREIVESIRETIREAVSEPRASLAEKLFLTLDEASIYSGLSITFLRREIEEGKLTAIKAGPRGALVVNRAELEHLAGTLTGKRRR